MSRTVLWDPAAADALRALARRNPALARRIGVAVDRYAETGHGDVRKLQGTADEWRLRVEGYFNPKVVRAAWQEYLDGTRNRHYHLWDVLMFQAWLEHWGKVVPPVRA